jgi:hypothetical protein
MHKIKLYTIVLSALFFVFLIALVILINSSNPDSLSKILLFYFLSSVAVFCLSTLLAFFARRKLGQRELQNQYLRISIREGVWLMIIFEVSLFLLSQNFFTWISVLSLVLTFVFLESYLLTKTHE